MTQDTADGRSGTYEEALRELGNALTDLRRQRGDPSYDRIRARGLKVLKDSQASSSKGTMSPVFAGRTYISLDKLLWLVRAVMSWDQYGAECTPPDRQDPVLGPWRACWTAINVLRATRKRPAVEPKLPSHLVQPETLPATSQPPGLSGLDIPVGGPLNDHAGALRSRGFSSEEHLPAVSGAAAVPRGRGSGGIRADRLGAVSPEQIASLSLNSVTEDYDLDFKAALNFESDKARHSLAGDVAAFANTSGGVLVFGVDTHEGRAVAAPGVTLSDADSGRIQEIIAHLVHPRPEFEIRPVQDPEGEGHGFLLIGVPRSPLAPHAVRVDGSLRYPRRSGPTTTYLSEAQVALAYQERFVGLQQKTNDLMRYEADLVQRLNGTDQTFVVVTLAPDVSGNFVLDTKAMREFQQQTTGKDPWLIPRGAYFERATVGSRRLIAYTGTGPNAAKFLACELHQSGAGAVAMVANRQSNSTGTAPGDPGTRLVDDEDLVLGVISGLRFLARHARDRAGVDGNATVRVSLWPVSEQTPTELHQYRGFVGRLGSETVTQPPESSGVFDVDDLADDGPELVAATADLSGSLIQHFGYPEALQMTGGGVIRTRYWSDLGYRPRLLQWASEVGVPTTDEAVS